MRVTRLVLVGLLAAVAAGGAGAARAAVPPPALAAKQARARAVLAQVNALGIRFGKVVDAWDGAKIELAASEHRLAANARALDAARRRSRVDEARFAQRLVAVYKGGEPGLGTILLGSASLSDLVDRLEAAKTIVGYDRRLALAAARSQAQLAAARRRLAATARRKRAVVTRLAAGRKTIGAMLAHRERLLSSVRSEVAVLQQQEAARQRRLAAQAKARLAREQAQRAEAQRVAAQRVAAQRVAAQRAAAQRAAAQRAKAEAEAKAAQAARPATTTPAATTTTAATTTATTTAQATTGAAATTAATTTATTPAAPPQSAGAGEPEAAAIALKYVGIPYRWGGASPATGFDCSGFVMYVFAQLGIELPHQSQAQYAYGVPVARSQLLPGDLVFYDDLSHVAIYIGHGDVVHAPQTGDVVRIVPLDAAGGSYVGARRL